MLANEFIRRGHCVCVFAFRFDSKELLAELDSKCKVIELSNGWLTELNRKRMREIIVERHIDIVLNQWCMPVMVSVFLRRAISGTGAKLLSVHHNVPTTNKRIQSARSWVLKKLWRVVTAISLRLVYELSDQYILLSESFIPLFKEFIHINNGRKISVITNPLTIDVVTRPKENLIIYVGRLEETQKRVSRIIEIWRLLAHELPLWRLEIIGDGPDRDKYRVAAAGIERIYFLGYKSPAEYYARAKLILLTSDFEGFPLVLLEAMASRCVPVVFGSYPAAYDIVKGKEGRAYVI